ncbi:MAG: Stage II sporulation protein M [Firmicutes bacterium ADurb.Bin193]|nr:MAG: Stage II sporulation protein M [Firmicutes bacterium ADurb.Bin193]
MSVISGFCTGISDGEIRVAETFRLSAINNLRSVAIIYLCALPSYLFPIIYLHMGAKGFVTGFTVGFMSLFFGGKGFLFVLVSVVPQSLILIPAIMVMSVFALNFGREKRKTARNAFLKDERRRELIKFSYATFVICIVMLFSAAIDTFVIPIFVKGVSGFF